MKNYKLTNNKLKDYSNEQRTINYIFFNPLNCERKNKLNRLANKYYTTKKANRTIK